MSSNRPINVFKFGGAAVANAEAIRHVAEIIKQHNSESLVVVISAMKNVTNQLEAVVSAHQAQDGSAITLLQDLQRQHFEVARDLLGEEHAVFAELNDHFVGVEWTLEEEPHPSYDFDYDQIVSLGELASTTIVTAYLQEMALPVHWLDARSLILTDDIFRNGWVQWEETQKRCDRYAKPLIDAGQIVLTQGFIASTTENFTITLGREGSDYTAAILSYCLDAENMSIWKDVPGVLTADPRMFENAQKLDRLSYKEAIEMTYYGAKVIHPKTIKPLQNKSIPLHVRSFLEPDRPGTMITDAHNEVYPPMIAVERNQALCSIATRDFSFVAEHHISHIFALISDLRLRVNLMQNTAISFNVCFTDADDKVDRLAEALGKQFVVQITRDLEMITIRHYDQLTIDNMRQGKIVLVEERQPQTATMVVKEVPSLQRK